jgi:hypothetical protein
MRRHFLSILAACALAASSCGALGFSLPVHGVTNSAVLLVARRSAVRPLCAAELPLPPHLSKMLEEIESGEAQLFDVREQGEYDDGSIALSALCALSALKNGEPPASGDKTKLTYVHCQAGKRAKMAEPLLE